MKPPIERVDIVDQASGISVDPLGAFDAEHVKYRLNIDAEERALLQRLLDEMSTLLTAEPDERTALLLHRLFPPAFHDDPDKEAEYQRLMREDLVASRLAAIDTVRSILDDDGSNGDVLLDEATTMAFMQSTNSVRLVLGSLLGITDDETAELADEEQSAEHGLYAYLGWLLEWTVRAVSGI